MQGTIIYTVIYAIPKGTGEAKDEIIKPVRSAPVYEEYFPRFKLLVDDQVHEINGRKILIDIKSYADTNLLIEAQTPFDLKNAQGLLSLKKTLYEECKKLALAYDPSPFFEEYLFFLVKDYPGSLEKYMKRNAESIAAILKDEPIKLVQKEIDDTLASSIRYGRQDIAVVDWDGAFLLDSTGEFKETIAVLELANIQLLNLRILDTKLADKVGTLKRSLEPQSLQSFFKLPPYMKDVVRIRSQSVLELEVIENSLKLYGDWYSGKLYELASKKFHLDRWKSTVNGKLEVLKDLYEMATNGMTERYNLILEFLIVVLIVFEIVMAFVIK